MRIHFAFYLLVFLLINQNATASVVMSGTRIIYDGHHNVQSVNITNPDEQPYIVQIKIENDASTKDPVPFVATPVIFKLRPHSGQTVRIVYQGVRLPKNKESLFYFNFTQLPAIKSTEKSDNHLVLVITNRVKLFYRPATLSGDISKLADSLTYSKCDGFICVSNPTAYYVVIKSLEITMPDNKRITMKAPATVAPGSGIHIPAPQLTTPLTGADVHITLINDYGSDVTTQRRL